MWSLDRKNLQVLCAKVTRVIQDSAGAGIAPFAKRGHLVRAHGISRPVLSNSKE